MERQAPSGLVATADTKDKEKRRHLPKSEMVNLSKVYKTSTVKLENKAERQFCVPVWSHGSRKSSNPAKTSS